MPKRDTFRTAIENCNRRRFSWVSWNKKVFRQFFLGDRIIRLKDPLLPCRKNVTHQRSGKLSDFAILRRCRFTRGRRYRQMRSVILVACSEERRCRAATDPAWRD